jgi:ABC-type cobalamin/Fe3+-siderophores transport system ATPase subunit
MATLYLSIPEDMKAYIKAKATDMNTSVSDIFINYIKLLRASENKEKQIPSISENQQAKIMLARKLAGSIVIDDEIAIDELRLKHLLEKHLKNE